LKNLHFSSSFWDSDSLFIFKHYDEDGILLLEVNRMLRAGGYFAWAAQPVYKHEQVLEEQWEGIYLVSHLEIAC
jgi:hypothetical protein